MYLSILFAGRPVVFEQQKRTKSMHKKHMYKRNWYKMFTKKYILHKKTFIENTTQLK